MYIRDIRSLLLLLDTENEPRHIIELIRAMKDIDEMQALANEMSVQYKAMSVQCDGPTDSEEYTYTRPTGSLFYAATQNFFPLAKKNKMAVFLHLY